MATAARQRTLAGPKAMQPAAGMPVSSVMHLGLPLAPGTGALPRPAAARVFVAAESELHAEMYARMLKRSSGLAVVGKSCDTPFEARSLTGSGADVLLLTTRGNFMEDLDVIRNLRSTLPELEIVLLGDGCAEHEFLQFVRAGVRGYLSREVRAEELARAIVDVRSGSAVCPGKLCARLFRYFESEAKSLPSASVHQRLGLTRREQQLIPLVARGLTNKEIANHFSLSEQTVKNHLYRMKHKIGAEDRLSIVHVCRMQGFMV
jgi:two-component system, NarL family, response regulator DevR